LEYVSSFQESHLPPTRSKLCRGISTDIKPT
jgi:hypothetical protein